MGVVYRAYDREIEQDVALKTVDDPEHARKLKREFRAVADLSHPNLVEIHELFAESRQSFFTMELLEGVDFVQFVRGQAPGADGAELPPEAFERAIAALGQLVDGVAAIHTAGILHRDIKPSNVLVCPSDTSEGQRVVLLDFGLVSPVALRSDPESGRGQLAGTPARMPPEQLWGEAVGPPSDWYGVGMLLYEALTGLHPHIRLRLGPGGTRNLDPPRVRQRTIPEWLDALVVELLADDPKARPTAGDVRQRITRARSLGWRGSARNEPAQRRTDGTHGPQLSTTSQEVFIGRRNELGRLHDAFHEVREGGVVAALVSGVSGIGKTELLRRFTQRLRVRNELVVLRGRCHLRESVPFAGFDQVIDDLVAHVASLEPGRVDLLPEHAAQLKRLFPAFQGVPPFDRAAIEKDATEPTVLRHLAAGALRDILTRLAAHTPIVMWIDDLQWTTEDSNFLLRSLLRPPAPPRLMLLLSYRSEERSDNEVLGDVLRFIVGTQDVRVVDIEAGPLEPDESFQLVSELVERLGGEAGNAERDIARESEGSPFFIGELVRHHANVAARRRGAEPAPVHLDEVMRRRFDALSPIARRVLETVAVAGAPIPRDVILRAVGLGTAGRSVTGALEKQCLLKSSIANGVRRLRPYHDRIGESLLEQLSPDARLAGHRALALTLEGEPGGDPEALVTHWMAAGDPKRAGYYAVAAAERASLALAFRRAADLYETAIEYAPPTNDRQPLRVALAEALANSGHGARAAACFEQASNELTQTGDNEVAVMALRQRAAQQFLCCGLIDEGLAIMRELAPRLGLSMPRSPAAAVRSFLWERLRIALRGLDFERRDAGGIATETLTRMDAIFGTAKGVSMVTPTVAAALHAQHLILALDLGEPSRVSQALTNEAAWCAIIGGKRYWRRADTVLRRTAELTTGATSPYDEAFFRMGAGSVAWSRGDWHGAITQSTIAIDLYRRRCRGVAFEIAITNVFFLSALALAGRISELTERTHAGLQDARERGDLFGMSACIMPEPVLTWLVTDQADLALAQADEAIQRWPSNLTLTQHYHHLIATGEALLYAGRPWEAWRRITTAWPQLRRAHYLSLACPRHLLLFLRASTAIAAAVGPPDPSMPRWTAQRLVRRARRDARLLARGPLPFTQPCAQIIRAALAVRNDDTREAGRLLQSAVVGFDLAAMPVHREAARLRLGGVLASGGEHSATALNWMTTHGIRRPERLARVFAAGFVEDRVE